MGGLESAEEASELSLLEESYARSRKETPFLGFKGKEIEEKRGKAKKEDEDGGGKENLVVGKKGLRVNEDMVQLRC